MAPRALILVVAIGVMLRDVACAQELPLKLPLILPPPAYQLAAQETGVPSVVLYAIALQESGRAYRGDVRPWPWTLNVAGSAHYFSTQRAACRHLQRTLQSTSARRVDVGLGQINVGYHGERVEAPCELLDPYTNLSIAATILREQHLEGQDWLTTMGRYHSPANGVAAARYRMLARQRLAQVLGDFKNEQKTSRRNER